MSACADRLLLHALADGELDAANMLAIEAHVRGCAGCAAEYERIVALRARIAAAGLHHRAPRSLRDAVEREIVQAQHPAPPRHSPSTRKRGGWLHSAGAALGGLAAGIALMLVLPVHRPAPAEPQAELVADHVRSLLAGHLTDVQTADQHLVRPWFNGRVDFAPAVPELSTDGFPLAGGRLDYVHGRVVAAIVYRRRLHSINLFVWPHAEGQAGVDISHEDGFNLVHWSQDGLAYWAVSDLNTRELLQFQQSFGRRSVG